MHGFSIPVIISETNLCLFPPPFLPCLTTAGCRLPGEEVIFSLVFSALFHVYVCFWAGFQQPAQGGKEVYQQAKAASFSFTEPNHVLEASSKCLCVLLLAGIEFIFSIVPGMGLHFRFVLETVLWHRDVSVSAQQCWHRVKAFPAPNPPH